MRAKTPFFSLKRLHIRGFLSLVAVSIVLSVLRRISQRTVILVLSFFILLSLTLTVFLPQKSQQTQSHAAGAAQGFVTRSGSQLFLNGQPFRFAGADIYYLGLDENVGGITYPTHFAVDNVLATAKTMNATVIRSASLGFSVGCAKCLEPSLNTFNDTIFQSIDYAIQRSGQYGLHLIIPLVDNWHFYLGGKHTFTDWRGDPNENDFYTNPTVIQDFKNYIAHLLNHVNQYTGVALKDDPTILAWETGNELHTATDTWTEMIAEYIKSIDPNHLVADGKTVVWSTTASQLQLPAIDMYTTHYYPAYVSHVQKYAKLVRQYNKVYYAGEYDWTGNHGSDPLPALLSAYETTPGFSGDLFWSLFGKMDNGQYEQHHDGYTLHYPGDSQDMQTRVQLLAAHAARMSSAATTPMSTTSSADPTTPTPALSSAATTPAQPTITPMSTTIPTDPTTLTPALSSNIEAVTGFTLINARQNTVLQPITDGATIYLSSLPTSCLNIRANTNPATVGSVLFGYDGNATYHLENYAPYDLGNDYGHGNDPMCWTLTTGSHTLTATPYGRAKAIGARGTPLTVHFTVI